MRRRTMSASALARATTGADAASAALIGTAVRSNASEIATACSDGSTVPVSRAHMRTVFKKWSTSPPMTEAG